MTTKLLHLNCPEYQFDNLDLKEVSKSIDKVLLDNFRNQEVVIRGIQSQKHDIPRDELVAKIIGSGTDRFDNDSKHAIKVNDKPIDLFGMVCKINGSISLRLLKGFHVWKPMSLEKPQRKVDIWMVYDVDQLENVEYFHSHYKVMAHDGYVFKNPDQKTEALLGVLVID